MQKVRFFSIAILLFLTTVSFFSPEKGKIKWMSIKELKKAYNKDPRPILVDVYTSWCGWCKQMDRVTYSNDKLAAYINSHYYPVKFDAESQDSVEFGGKNYSYLPEQRIHQLALYLLFNRPGYPTTVFLSAVDAQPAPIPGFMKPAEMEAPLRFFGDKYYKTQTYVEFMKSFKAGW
jgi:thioredoxin-related protein